MPHLAVDDPLDGLVYEPTSGFPCVRFEGARQMSAAVELESSLSIRRHGVPDPVDEELEAILTSFDTNYVWNYGTVEEGLRELYEKSKREQWNGAVLAWSTQVDPEQEIIPSAFNPLEGYAPYRKLDEREKRQARHAQISWQLSQFMHGEQGAMIVASQLVGAVPWMDAKYYASSQVMDEARHVEVFSRYVREKLEWE